MITNDNYSYAVENMVYTAELVIKDKNNKKIDLPEICRKNSNVEYNPERFPGLVYRIDKPKSTALIFSTGKSVITGIKHESDIKDAVKKIENLIGKSIIEKDQTSVKLQNIVAAGQIFKNGKSVFVDLNLTGISMEMCLYEPEVFPGLIYRREYNGFKVVFLLFSTGKVVCAGLKDGSKLDFCFKNLHDDLDQNALISTSEEMTEKLNNNKEEDDWTFL